MCIFGFVRDLLSQFQVQPSEAEIWSTLLAMEREGVECGLLCNLSFFEDAITKDRKGSISRISEFSFTGANLFHAVFQAMIKDFLSCADRLVPPDGCLRRIVFSGGVARRVEAIRHGIAGHYLTDTPITVAENETLTGIVRYFAILDGA